MGIMYFKKKIKRIILQNQFKKKNSKVKQIPRQNQIFQKN